MELAEQHYRERQVRFRRGHSVGPWRVKVYRVTLPGDEPSAVLEAAALALAQETLLGLAAHTSHYGVAILGIHQGKHDNLVFVSWWVDANELRHRVYRSPANSPATLRAVGSEDTVGCVWDLRILAFEAQAWVDEVLRPRRWDALEAYLAKGWTCDV
ncbi:MAG TPA: hypothetical protein VMM17_04855 [Gemmatimonadaceae bacterium]|nr:hypothetical protein [Gemmatimonadaceae bacterium]